MIWWVYNAIFAVFFTLAAPQYLLRMRRRGGYRRDFGQRFARYRPEVRAALAEGGRVWIHAVSVGELFVALNFMGEWRRRRPETRFLLSVNTSTAHAIARERVAAPDLLVYFPLDFPGVQRRFFRLAKPEAVALMECEFWPNLIRRAHRAGVPLYLVNGRVSDASFRGYRRLRFLARRLLPLFEGLFAQTETDRERLVALGAPAERVRTVGSAKYELPADPDGARARAAAVLRAAGFDEGDPVWVAGSTWPGEETMACEVHRAARERFPRLRFALAPRHVERAADIESEIAARGWRVLRRSALRGAGTAAGTPPDVLLLDTTGELKDFYAAADVVFVGKSLAARGGQNPIEPAALGKATLCGPHMGNFRGVVEDLRAAGALSVVHSAEEWTAELIRLLGDSAMRLEMGRRAAALVRSKSGALARTMAWIAGPA